MLRCHMTSWSSNRVECSTVRTDAGQFVWFLYIFLKAKEILQGWGGKAYRDYGFTSEKPVTQSMSHCTGTE